MPSTRLQVIDQLLGIVGLDAITTAHFIAAFLLWSMIRLTAPNSHAAFGFFFGLFPTQICLATAWAALSSETARIRFGRLAWHLAVAYFLVLLFSAIAGPRYFKTLWFTPLMVMPFVIAMIVLSSFVRWFGWRLVRKVEPSNDSNPTAQFRLLDIWRWSTQISLLLALMVCFREEPRGWDDMGYAIIFVVVAWECVPAAIIVSLVWWLAMGEERTEARNILLITLIAAWLLLAGLAFVGRAEDFPYFATWIMATVSCATSVVTAILVRRLGWRLTKR